MVGDSVAHNTNFRIVEKVTNSTIKTAKAYSSTWNERARLKHSKFKKVVKDELEKSNFDHLILAAPTVDITNLDTKYANSKDSFESFKSEIEESCTNMFKVAEDALEKNAELKKVTIMEHPPRYDTIKEDPISLKPKLANYANNFLQKLWVESAHNEQIMVGSHNLDCSPSAQKERFTDEINRKYDGIHMFGSEGKLAYTESLINILTNTLQTSPSLSSRALPANDYHTYCPQTKHIQKQRKLYSTIVRGNNPVGTQNKFAPLRDLLGN